MRHLGMNEEIARTVAVNTIVMFEVFYLFNTRFIVAPVLSFNGLFGSRPVLLAVALVVAFQFLFTYAAPMQRLFGTESIGPDDWMLILLVSVNVVWIVELDKWVARRRSWH